MRNIELIRNIQAAIVADIGENVNCLYFADKMKEVWPDARIVYNGDHVLTIIGDVIVDKDNIYKPIDTLERGRMAHLVRNIRIEK